MKKPKPKQAFCPDCGSYLTRASEAKDMEAFCPKCQKFYDIEITRFRITIEQRQDQQVAAM